MNAVVTAQPDVIPFPAALAAVWGAFLFEGLMTSDLDSYHAQEVLRVWGNGCIELIIETTACLTELWEQVSMTWNNRDGDFPGVFEYEVVSPLGEFLASYLLDHDGRLPAKAIISARITDLIYGFLPDIPGSFSSSFNNVRMG